MYTFIRTDCCIVQETLETFALNFVITLATRPQINIYRSVKTRTASLTTSHIIMWVRYEFDGHTANVSRNIIVVVKRTRRFDID